MAHTNSTSNYELPIFLGTDKPSWLSDFNGAMTDIDTQMKANADAASDADTKATAAAGAVSDLTPRVTTAEDDIDALKWGVSDLGGQIDTLAGELENQTYIKGGDTITLWGASGWLSGDKKTARFYIDFPKPSKSMLTLPTLTCQALTILIAASDGHIDGNTARNYMNEPVTITVTAGTHNQFVVTIAKDTAFNATYGNCPIFAHGTLSFEVQTAS